MLGSVVEVPAVVCNSPASTVGATLSTVSVKLTVSVFLKLSVTVTVTVYVPSSA